MDTPATLDSLQVCTNFKNAIAHETKQYQTGKETSLVNELLVHVPTSDTDTSIFVDPSFGTLNLRLSTYYL